MRAIEFLIDDIPARMAVEAVYVVPKNEGTREYLRIPNLLPTTNAAIEFMSQTVYLSPALCYCALPDGLAIGVGGLIKNTVDNPMASSTYKEFQPISRSLWPCDKVSHLDMQFSIRALVKKSKECVHLLIKDAVTPSILFKGLMQTIPELPLPGTLVIVELQRLDIVLNNQIGYEITLLNTMTQEKITHRYEVNLLD